MLNEALQHRLDYLMGEMSRTGRCRQDSGLRLDDTSVAVDCLVIPDPLPSGDLATVFLVDGHAVISLWPNFPQPYNQGRFDADNETLFVESGVRLTC